MTRSRWGVVGAYAALAAANQLLWLTYTRITTPAAHRYGVSASDVGWLSQVFPLLYVVLAAPAAARLHRAFRSWLTAGAILTGAGGALRLAGPSFGAALAGQLLVAIAQPLVLSAVTGVARTYLREPDRTAGIAIGSAGIFLGMLVSLVLGSALGGAHLGLLLRIDAILAVAGAAALVGALFLGHQPAVEDDVAGAAGLRAVACDPLIRRYAGMAFIGFGFFVALTTWLQTLLKPGGVSAGTAGWLLVAAVFTGVVGAAALPALVLRARRDVLLLRSAAVVTAAGCAVMAVDRSAPVVAVAICLSGLLLLASLPVLLELAEGRAGAAGTSAAALIWLAGNAGGIVIAVLVQAVVGHPAAAFALMGAIAAVGVATVPRWRRANDVGGAASGSAASPAMETAR